jgi:hypothetical protein
MENNEYFRTWLGKSLSDIRKMDRLGSAVDTRRSATEIPGLSSCFC